MESPCHGCRSGPPGRIHCCLDMPSQSRGGLPRAMCQTAYGHGARIPHGRPDPSQRTLLPMPAWQEAFHTYLFIGVAGRSASPVLRAASTRSNPRPTEGPRPRPRRRCRWAFSRHHETRHVCTFPWPPASRGTEHQNVVEHAKAEAFSDGHRLDHHHDSEGRLRRTRPCSPCQPFPGNPRRPRSQ